MLVYTNIYIYDSNAYAQSNYSPRPKKKKKNKQKEGNRRPEGLQYIYASVRNIIINIYSVRESYEAG